MRTLLILFSFIISASVNADMQLTHFSEYPDESSLNRSSPIIITKSPYSYKKTVANLKKAIKGKNYRLIRVQKVDQGYSDEEHESSDLIVYFCNFNLINNAIKKDSRVGQFLPCRITVIEREGSVYLISMNPKSISQVFNNPELKDTCNKVTNMYMDIMDEVTI